MVGKEPLIVSVNGARVEHEEFRSVKCVRLHVCACSAVTGKATERLVAYFLFFCLGAVGGVSGSNIAQERQLICTMIGVACLSAYLRLPEPPASGLCDQPQNQPSG